MENYKPFWRYKKKKSNWDRVDNLSLPKLTRQCEEVNLAIAHLRPHFLASYKVYTESSFIQCFHVWYFYLWKTDFATWTNDDTVYCITCGYRDVIEC